MVMLLIAATDAAASASLLDPGSLLPAVSAMGSLGFAVWYAYYTTTVVIPKLLEAHRAERQEMQIRFDNRLQQLLTELKEQRLDFTSGRLPGRPS